MDRVADRTALEDDYIEKMVVIGRSWIDSNNLPGFQITGQMPGRWSLDADVRHRHRAFRVGS